jgi:ABC-type nitrate/sulfonate/bicarbonate transport system ATPase subunit
MSERIYTEEEILLQIDDVSKEYDGKLVLKKVCATIKDIKVVGEVKGQVVGFIGPSGIGKTTLFRIMAGLDQPTSGRVVLDGTDSPVRAGEVGVVAQNYPLFDHRTVMGNLMRAARKHYPDKEARERVVAYLADFDLSAEANHYPHQLSGGQRQRCAILQQVLCGSKDILMDEPFSGLDPISKKKTQVLIQKIADLDEKNSIVIVTHDISAAAAVSDHIWALGRDRDDAGKIIPGAYIVETYNLIDRDLAWHQDIESTPQFVKFVQELTKRFATL